MREVLRQEKKYLMSYEQFRKLDNTFEKVLHPDPHNGVMGYAVRSLLNIKSNDSSGNSRDCASMRKNQISLQFSFSEFIIAWLIISCE